jgi:hypothetical protein
MPNACAILWQVVLLWVGMTVGGKAGILVNDDGAVRALMMVQYRSAQLRHVMHLFVGVAVVLRLCRLSKGNTAGDQDNGSCASLE